MIVTVVGARPQFIKAAAISHALAAQNFFSEIIVHTGQHYDELMSDVFFRDLKLPRPHYNLKIGSGSHGWQTGRMLDAIEMVLLAHRPTWLMVHGDTNSTVAGALAAAKLDIPIAHVEAGLRSFDRRMPEEVNRVVTDHLSTALFTPTSAASRNLRSEGIDDKRIHQVGDVMYDVISTVWPVAEKASRILAELTLIPGAYVLATIHRAENTNNPTRLQQILAALAEVSRSHRVVLPLHPRTRKAISVLPTAAASAEALCIIDPVSYLDMVVLEKNACLIATDSGGVQKEAFFARVPCVTLRDQTEWVELVEAGWNRLVPPAVPEQMASLIRAAIGSTGHALDEYGSGDAATHVIDTLRCAQR